MGGGEHEGGIRGRGWMMRAVKIVEKRGKGRGAEVAGGGSGVGKQLEGEGVVLFQAEAERPDVGKGENFGGVCSREHLGCPVRERQPGQLSEDAGVRSKAGSEGQAVFLVGGAIWEGGGGRPQVENAGQCAGCL